MCGKLTICTDAFAHSILDYSDNHNIIVASDRQRRELPGRLWFGLRAVVPRNKADLVAWCH